MGRLPKILYIDDEHDLLTLASSFFEDEDLPLDTSANFDDALAKIRAGSYDLIISDAKLPSGSGRELLSIIKAENLHCGKFILVTGNIDYYRESDKDFFDLVLFKPLPFSDLISHAKKILCL